nr:DUF6597 domain-containing transcriptional factor [Actinomadura craniellae]
MNVYEEFALSPATGLVCAWVREPEPAAPVARVVPDGCVDLIWWSGRGEVMVAGPDTGPHLSAVPAGERLVGVRFRPGQAPPALGVPADAVRDARVPLARLWGDPALRLADRLAGAGDPRRVLVAAVAGRGGPADPVVPAVVAGLAEGASVGEVAGRLGLSERQLRRRSVAAFGYGPKTLQRILRFRRAVRLARAGVPFAVAADAAGYADQAHLSREVRDLAGVPLRGLL